MIPNFISGPAKAAFQALRQPIKTGAAIRSITATLLIRGSDWVNNPDTQGNFNLPSELRRPFFIAAYIATFAVAAYYGILRFPLAAKHRRLRENGTHNHSGRC